jgi:hypothetical protein
VRVEEEKLETIMKFISSFPLPLHNRFFSHLLPPYLFIHSYFLKHTLQSVIS